jgi:hypothetical protein
VDPQGSGNALVARGLRSRLTPLVVLATLKVVGGSVTLPFLTYQRTDTIQGDPGTQLEDYLSETITVPPETMRDSVSSSFQLPPPHQPRP